MTAGLTRRIAYSVVSAVAPRIGVRWATDTFSNTRTLGIRPDNVLPLGARQFTCEGGADAPQGYLWEVEGDSQGTALLVHGWASDSSSMHSLVAPMREIGFTVAAFDGPAHGVREGAHATMTQYADAVGAVLRTLPDVRVVIAHSLGGIAAISGAVERTDTELDALVLIAPPCTLGGVLDRWDGSGLRVSPATVEGVYAELHRRNGVPVSHRDVVGLGSGMEVPRAGRARSGRLDGALLRGEGHRGRSAKRALGGGAGHRPRQRPHVKARAGNRPRLRRSAPGQNEEQSGSTTRTLVYLRRASPLARVGRTSRTTGNAPNVVPRRATSSWRSCDTAPAAVT